MAEGRLKFGNLPTHAIRLSSLRSLTRSAWASLDGEFVWRVRVPLMGLVAGKAASAYAHVRSFVGELCTDMPGASPPVPPKAPAPLRDGEREFIKEAVERFYGRDAVVRNFGPDPDRLELYVETDADADMRKYD